MSRNCLLRSGASEAKTARAAAAPTKRVAAKKSVKVTEHYEVCIWQFTAVFQGFHGFSFQNVVEAPPRAGRLYEEDRARRVKRHSVGLFSLFVVKLYTLLCLFFVFENRHILSLILRISIF